ncbi:hypothetical protein Poly30_42720 [Planctomycetes bacterium Poly30]|uniref:Uncharacterized protein n=1 Tax=Saltatorellus ferox TaxID=2528018 RepID=A0A518EXA2_9BACT|nr:hypothetical protein Poly30_42720 [Planctomycetes bacterium Poly30]
MGEVNAGLLLAVAGVLLGTALTVSAFLVSTARTSVGDRATLVPLESVCCSPEVTPEMILDAETPVAAEAIPVSVIEPASVRSAGVRDAGPCAAANCKQRTSQASSTAG